MPFFILIMLITWIQELEYCYDPENSPYLGQSMGIYDSLPMLIDN